MGAAVTVAEAVGAEADLAVGAAVLEALAEEVQAEVGPVEAGDAMRAATGRGAKREFL